MHFTEYTKPTNLQGLYASSFRLLQHAAEVFEEGSTISLVCKFLLI